MSSPSRNTEPDVELGEGAEVEARAQQGTMATPDAGPSGAVDEDGMLIIPPAATTV